MKEEIIQFWEGLYKEGKMPWDFGGVPFRLSSFIDSQESPKSVLIPGCGSAYEAKFLADKGFYVKAVDISKAAIERASEIIGDTNNVDLEVADFFDLKESEFDFIYERAFLCSFNPDLRASFVEHCSRLLSDKGRIFGFYFVDEERESGPPFPIEAKALKKLMSCLFDLVEDEVVEDGLDVFGGKERWQVWQKK